MHSLIEGDRKTALFMAKHYMLTPASRVF